MAPVPVRKQKGSKPGRVFQRGRFLSIDEIKKKLKDIKKELKDTKKELKDIKKELKDKKNGENPRMLEYITEQCNNLCMETMRRSRARLTVSRLQHVTGKEGFEGITGYQRFIGNTKGRFIGKRKNISASDKADMKRFSWWSVVTTKRDIISLKKEAYQDLLERQISSEITSRKRKVTNQFANSPVFKESSRYGNFKFSFPVQELMDAYEAQHCTPRGGTLVYRVLGTWTYQQEILHAVLIHGSHSQHNNQFRDLPEITGDSGEPIYRDNDGTFRCNLESSSDHFTLRITRHGMEDLGRRPVSCVWSNPAFAFYLPEETDLKMEITDDNLKPCEILEPRMWGGGEPTPYPDAERLIREHFTKRKRNETEQS